jgi:hypothetical protein
VSDPTTEDEAPPEHRHMHIIVTPTFTPEQAQVNFVHCSKFDDTDSLAGEWEREGDRSYYTVTEEKAGNSRTIRFNGDHILHVEIQDVDGDEDSLDHAGDTVAELMTRPSAIGDLLRNAAANFQVWAPGPDGQLHPIGQPPRPAPNEPAADAVPDEGVVNDRVDLFGADADAIDDVFGKITGDPGDDDDDDDGQATAARGVGR